MDGYIHEVCTQYGHATPTKPEHLPHIHHDIIYSAKQQVATNDLDTTPALDAKGLKWCQGVIGSFLYYTHAVNNKLFMTLSAIGAQQVTATEQTKAAITKLLNYVATYPTDGVTYHASDMILATHFDASFFSEP